MGKIFALKMQEFFFLGEKYKFPIKGFNNKCFTNRIFFIIYKFKSMLLNVTCVSLLCTYYAYCS